MKKTKIIYWIATSLFVLFEGVMPALTFNSQMAKDGIHHLGYPDYFGAMLAFYKVVGAIILILPMLKGAIKEWAYAGFTFDLISASVSLIAVDGLKGQSFFPLIVLAVLATSYFTYKSLLRHRISKEGRYRSEYSVSGVTG
jgi:hypothetical protein